MPTIERAALAIAELDKAAGSAPRPIRGWASTYDNPDRLGRIMKVGAFGSTLGGQAHSGAGFASFKVPLLAYHQDEQPVGASTMEPKAATGMRHDSALASTDFARDMAALIDAGAIPATSIGWDPASADWSVNEKGHREYAYIDVMENSLCPCPANALAILDAASLTSSGAPPAWEADVPDWIKELWPDFARLQFREPETFNLSSHREAARWTGMFSEAARAGVEPKHGHDRYGPYVDYAAGARHSQADQASIQTAHDALVDVGAECQATAILEERDVAATWTTAVINGLPDSSFAIVLDGGTKDDSGKTVPRSLRKLPYKGADGKVDKPHLRNALARVGQTKGLSDAQRTAAKKKLLAAAKDAGIETEAAAALLYSQRDRAAVQGSFEELRDVLNDGLRAAYPGQYPWVRATYPDAVVYELDSALIGSPGGTFRVAYTIDDDSGEVDFGVPEPVEITEVVKSAPAGGMTASLELETLELEAEAAALG